MSLSELEKRGEIQKTDKDINTSKKLLTTAEKDIGAAKDILSLKRYGWTLAIAYTAMLNAGRALMFAKGYRTISDSHHLTVIKFCSSTLPENLSHIISLFNRYRIRRNDIVYGEVENQVSESEAKKIIKNADLFVKEIEKIIKKD